MLHLESSRGFGGQEIRILAEADWLRRRGWPVLIATVPHGRLLAAARARGLPAAPVAMRHALDLAAVLALRRLMRASRAGIVHTHSSVDSWLGTVAAGSLGLPVVRSRHVTIPVRRRRAWVYRRADAVIASAEFVRRGLIAAGVPAERIVTVPAGVDLDRFHPGVSGAAVRRELGLTGPVVGLIADMRSSKGHRFFLEAARRLLARVPEVRFLVVGDGVLRDSVRRWVADLGLQEAVTLTGFRHDVPEVMAALDVVAVPSVREAISQVLLQALALGRPVVTTTVGGNPEVVRDGETGRLVPPADPEALAAALADLLRSPAEAARLAAAGCRQVRERYGLDAMMARTVEVYDTVRRR